MIQLPYDQNLYDSKLALARKYMPFKSIHNARLTRDQKQLMIDQYRVEIPLSPVGKPMPNAQYNHDVNLAWCDAARERLAIFEWEDALLPNIGLRLADEQPMTSEQSRQTGLELP